MTTLQNKIDFAIVFSVDKANPNGDPLYGNRPRTDYAGYGEVSDVCLKRKLRDRLLDRYQLLEPGARKGQAIFVQSDDYKIDAARNLRERAELVLTPDVMKNRRTAIEKACAEWFDVRAFGQVFPFKGKKAPKKKLDANGADGASSSDSSEKDADGVSIPVRGPVTIQSAFSVEKVDIESEQIVKSTSLEGDGEKRQKDQMGMKHRVHKGIYVCFGSMNPQLAERTGFSDDDAATLKAILPRLFENDASSARPEGSMAVKKVIWWHHGSKAGNCSSAKVHGSLTVDAEGNVNLADTCVKPEEIDGF